MRLQYPSESSSARLRCCRHLLVNCTRTRVYTCTVIEMDACSHPYINASVNLCIRAGVHSTCIHKIHKHMTYIQANKNTCDMRSGHLIMRFDELRNRPGKLGPISNATCASLKEFGMQQALDSFLFCYAPAQWNRLEHSLVGEPTTGRILDS